MTLVLPAVLRYRAIDPTGCPSYRPTTIQLVLRVLGDDAASHTELAKVCLNCWGLVQVHELSSVLPCEAWIELYGHRLPLAALPHPMSPFADFQQTIKRLCELAAELRDVELADAGSEWPFPESGDLWLSLCQQFLLDPHG